MFKVKCSLGSEVHTDISRVPLIIKNTLNGKAEFIEIINEDDDMSELYNDYSKEMDALEFMYMKNAGYRAIVTTKDGRTTNPCYFHIPGSNKDTISFYRDSDTVIVKKVDITEAISHMTEHDIKLNEVLNDSEHLRGIDAYDKRVELMKDEIEASINYFDNIEGIDPAIVFN